MTLAFHNAITLIGTAVLFGKIVFLHLFLHVGSLDIAQVPL